MKLVVDVGNSRVKWARIDDDQLDSGSHFERREPLVPVLDARWAGLEAPVEVLISSVAGPGFDARLEQWMVERWRRRPAWFRSEPETLGIVNGYTDPTRLGSDRWAAVVGARGSVSGAVGVIDCGTAVTLDVVDGADRHLGGWIFPGLELSQQSLLANTANVRETPRQSTDLLGRDTAGCVANGTVIGLAGVLDRWMATVERRLEGVTWVATGGDWSRLGSVIEKPVQYDPDLVLRGLARVLA